MVRCLNEDLKPSIPKRFTATPQPDGSTLVGRTTSDRRSGIGISLLTSVPFYGMFAYAAVPYFRTYEG